MSENIKINNIIAFPDDYTVVTVGTLTFRRPDADFALFGSDLYAARVRRSQIVDRLSLAFSWFDPEGLTADDGRTPIFASTAYDTLLCFLGDDIIVGHNNSYVYTDLARYLQEKGETLQNKYLDTMRIARKLFPQRTHHRLQDVSLYLSVDGSKVYDGSYPYNMQYVAELTVDCFECMKALARSKFFDDAFFDLFKRRSVPVSVIIEGLRPRVTEFDDTHPFFGKRIVFTGALSRMTRKEAAQLVLDVGGIPADKMNKETNYLVIGNEDFKSCVKNGKSAKMLKAEEMQKKGIDILVISEDQFFDMLEV